MQEHIHPIFDRILKRSDKEALLGQSAKLIWLTGLSGSGKSTIAQHLEKKLHQAGKFTQLLDGDNIRSGLNNNLGFSEDDRAENIRRIAEVAKLFVGAGIITICSFISPTVEIRHTVKEIVGEDDYLEVYINAPIEVCEDRDVKGLYQKARAGQIKNFTGIDSPYEAPVNPFMEIHSDELDIETSVNLLFEKIFPLVEN